jgi:RNA recognition motif-containing protein
MNNYSYVSISMQMATETSTKKLLIGNLPDSTQTAAVENLFKVVGRVLSVNVVRNGFAFVEMTSADADKARQQLNGYRFNGKAMMIDEAHPRPNTRQ